MNYSAIDMSTLQPGMLVERPLYIFLAANQRYIRMVKPLHPLETRVLEKLNRLGQVYSSEPAIDERYPRLAQSAQVVRELCENEEYAPFEKNIRVRAMTEWLVPHALEAGADFSAPLFFFHRAFGVPKAETLLHVSDVSVVIYEQSLKVATISGLIALWLGYSDVKFLAQYVESVFCEQVYQSGDVPGVVNADYRFRFLMTKPARCDVAGDELHRIMEFARGAIGVADARGSGRIARKLKAQFERKAA